MHAMSRPGTNGNLVRLLVVQTQVSFNDNAAKLALIGLAGLVLPAEKVGGTVGLLAALLVLPFLLFSPLFGWMADRFPKASVLRLALVFQIAAAALLTTAVSFRALVPAVAGFFLLALQAAAFSPAKQGILKEIVGAERLNRAVSWMESLTIVAILAGGFAGGLLLDRLTEATGDAWTGGALALGILTAACGIAWLVFRPVTVEGPAPVPSPFRLSLLWDHFGDVSHLARRKPLFAAAAGIAWFYGLGGFLYLTLVEVGRQVRPGVGAASEAGWLLTLLGVGIIAGATLYAFLSKGKIVLRFLPLSAAAMAGALFALAALPLAGGAFQAVLFLLGLAGGTFAIPLNAFLQDRVESHERGRILAAGNLLTNGMGIAAVGLHGLLSGVLHLAPGAQIAAMAGVTVVVSLFVAVGGPRHWLRLIASVPARLLYRVRIEGAEHLPSQGGVLLVSNHVSYVDALLIGVHSRRLVHFMAFDAFFRIPILGTLLRLSGAIPVSARRPKEAMARAIDLLKAGEVVCIFPEGELTRTGEVMGFKRGCELLSKKAEVPVVPIHLDSLWGSVFSFEGGRFFWKWPAELPRRVTMAFGPSLPPGSAAEEARRAVIDLEEKSFRAQPELQGHLGMAALRRLAATPGKELISDCSDPKHPASMTCAQALAAALVLAAEWKRTLPGVRIGVALPPGRGGLIANLALVLAGKIPVNLNVTASRASAEASLKAAGVADVISAPAVQAAFPKYPWSERTHDLAAAMKGLPKNRLALAWLGATLLPSPLLARIHRVPRKGGDAEALLLFTSGSSGDPKGVPLTHANLLANVAQVSRTGLLRSSDRIFGCLPLFHCFGLTFTLWTPLLRKVALVTTPSPLDAAKVGAAVAAGKATLLLGTPTFLRTYARKVGGEAFSSLRLAVAGAEKLPADLIETYRTAYGVSLVEGYGLTETSPVLAFNLPPEEGKAETVQEVHRPGSVGRILPGIAYRLADPETGALLPSVRTGAGLLQVKGASVFGGYLDDPARTSEVLRDGWFVTGDLARIDEDGFLFIEGRLSRFAKIGGEMVPLAKVEEAVVAVLGLKSDAGIPAVVVAVPHATKGEELVLLAVEPVEREVLRRALAEAGLPNLWIPRSVRRVETIPLLGTGKVDWRACRELALSDPNEPVGA